MLTFALVSLFQVFTTLLLIIATYTITGNLNVGVILGIAAYSLLFLSIIYQSECCGTKPVLLLSYIFFLFTLIYNINLLSVADPALINNLRVYHVDSYNFYAHSL